MLSAERESNQAADPVRWPNGAPKLYEHPREQRDFVKRLHIAEAIKQDMRRRYAMLTRKKDDFTNMKRRAEDFWAGYEEVNLLWVPEDPVYSKALEGVTLNTTNDMWELAAASAGQLRILESFVGSEGTTSAAARIRVARVSSQGTGTAPTAYTPEKFNTRSPAAAGTYYGAINALVTWGTAQATLATNSLILHAFNALGGSDRWVAQPGEEIYSVNAEYISMRSAAGTAVTSAYVVVEEM